MIIATPEAMVALGKEIGASHNFVLLEWELGAGKTHFVKGFAEAKGIDPENVKSPTYTYIHEHGTDLLHVDMYRMDDENEHFLIEKGILEKIQNYPAVIIERPKFTDQYVDNTRQTICITKTSPTEREVTIL